MAGVSADHPSSLCHPAVKRACVFRMSRAQTVHSNGSRGLYSRTNSQRQCPPMQLLVITIYCDRLFTSSSRLSYRFTNWTTAAIRPKLLGKSFVYRRLQICPQTQDLGIRKWQDLRADHPRHSLLAITPPEQVRQTRPPGRPRRPPSRSPCEHKGQPPALRSIAGIQVRDRIRELGLRVGDALPAKVGELGDLVPEHLVDGFLPQDLFSCRRGGPVVEQRGQDF